MGKLDDLKRMAGGNVAESASKRAGSPTIPASPSPLAGLNPARLEGVARSKTAFEVPLDRIERDPDQPREAFDPESLQRLAESIRTRGLLQPARVRWDEGRGVYVLIAGERRWRAARMAGLSTMTCVVVEGDLAPAELLAIQVTENLQREDLNPLERARAYATLMRLNGWSGNQLAKELGISQSGVVHALALLELPEPVQDQVERGELAPSVGYELSKVADPAAQQALARRAAAEGLSRDETIQAVRAATAATSTSTPKRRSQGRAGRTAKPIVKTWRTSVGKVTVELRKGQGPDALPIALAEALAHVETSRPEPGQAA